MTLYTLDRDITKPYQKKTNQNKTKQKRKECQFIQGTLNHMMR